MPSADHLPFLCAAWGETCLLFQPSKAFFRRPVGVLAFCSQGGGLWISDGGEAFLASCTISGNGAGYVSACLSTFESLLPSPRWSTPRWSTARWSTDTCVLARAHRDLAFRA